MERIAFDLNEIAAGRREILSSVKKIRDELADALPDAADRQEMEDALAEYERLSSHMEFAEETYQEMLRKTAGMEAELP